LLPVKAVTLIIYSAILRASQYHLRQRVGNDAFEVPLTHSGLP